MKVLISTIGSRGEVQPILGLAMALRALGHEATLCMPPNFAAWVASFGFASVPIGPDVKKLTAAGAVVPASKEQKAQSASGTVVDQFSVLTDAARGHDLLVGTGALQIAARSVAEALGIPHVFVAYCPVDFPSAHHPPPAFGGVHHCQTLPESTNRTLWDEVEQSWNTLFRGALNEGRASLGLAPVESARRHVFTERPWLAADPFLAPRPSDVVNVVQTGAWRLADPAPLPPPLEDFLARGDAPVYVGFGSMRGTPEMGALLVEAARALGVRAIVSQGWGGLAPAEDGEDVLSIGDVAHDALFPRVAAVVHHGGAGTTTTAACAGCPQLIVPHMYDQDYWAYRVQTLGIGVAGPPREALTLDTVRTGLHACLRPEVVARARESAQKIEPGGARIAAERLVREFG